MVSFSNLRASGTAGTYTITYALATDSSVSVAQTGFELTAGTGTKLAITTQPSNVVSGVAFDANNATNKRVTVVVQDAWGNLVSDATNAITPDAIAAKA